MCVFFLHDHLNNLRALPFIHSFALFVFYVIFVVVVIFFWLFFNVHYIPWRILCLDSRLFSLVILFWLFSHFLHCILNSRDLALWPILGFDKLKKKNQIQRKISSWNVSLKLKEEETKSIAFLPNHRPLSWHFRNRLIRFFVLLVKHDAISQ